MPVPGADAILHRELLCAGLEAQTAVLQLINMIAVDDNLEVRFGPSADVAFDNRVIAFSAYDQFARPRE